MPDRQTLEHLLQTLSPEPVGEGSFLGQNTHPDGVRVYGGQVLAQVLKAAAETVGDERVVHSQHAYFLRPGDPREPIRLEVENARDGGSFSSRRVVALQRGRPILVSSMSFQIPEHGDDYQPEMPQVPGPDGLESEREREMAIATMMPATTSPTIPGPGSCLSSLNSAHAPCAASSVRAVIVVAWKMVVFNIVFLQL